MTSSVTIKPRLSASATISIGRQLHSSMNSDRSSDASSDSVDTEWPAAGSVDTILSQYGPPFERQQCRLTGELRTLCARPEPYRLRPEAVLRAASKVQALARQGNRPLSKDCPSIGVARVRQPAPAFPTEGAARSTVRRGCRALLQVDEGTGVKEIIHISSTSMADDSIGSTPKSRASSHG
jgi:hypothetical protein